MAAVIRNAKTDIPAVSGIGEILLRGFNTRVLGTDFDDRIVDLTAAHHEIDGGDGKDELVIAEANGSATGGLGDDTIGAYAEGGVLPQGNTLDGGENNDLLIGSEGAEILLGGTGDDVVHGAFGQRLG